MSTDSTSIRIPRADLLASVQTVLGVVFLFVVGGSIVTGESPITIGYNAVLSVFWFGVAGYTHWNPDAYVRGSDPASRRWLVLAGGFVMTVVAGAVLVVVL